MGECNLKSEAFSRGVSYGAVSWKLHGEKERNVECV